MSQHFCPSLQGIVVFTQNLNCCNFHSGYLWINLQQHLVYIYFFWYCSLIYSVWILSASNFWPVTQHKYVFMTAFLSLLFVVSVSKDLKVPVSTVIERELQKLLGNKDLKQFNSDFLERHSRSLLHRLSGNDHMFVCNFLLFSDLSSFETRGFPQRFMAYVTQTWSGLIHWYN